MILSLDPGIRASGVAMFGDSGALIRAAHVRSPSLKDNGPTEWEAMARAVWEWAGNGQGFWRVALEVMVVRAPGQQKGRQSDLIPLVGVAASVAARPWVSERAGYFPEQWKGQGNEAATTARVKGRLTPAEFSRIEFPRNTCDTCRTQTDLTPCVKSTCLAHNIFDGVGIGLKDLGRFERHRVIAR